MRGREKESKREKSQSDMRNQRGKSYVSNAFSFNIG
jgi:hypothetical protein